MCVLYLFLKLHVMTAQSDLAILVILPYATINKGMNRIDPPKGESMIPVFKEKSERV